jgi:hypothetical protein
MSFAAPKTVGDNLSDRLMYSETQKSWNALAHFSTEQLPQAFFHTPAWNSRGVDGGRRRQGVYLHTVRLMRTDVNDKVT